MLLWSKRLISAKYNFLTLLTFVAMVIPTIINHCCQLQTIDNQCPMYEVLTYKMLAFQDI